MPIARSFESTPESVINAIGQNLDDRYPRDAIIKELLQNADDAAATAVDVAWVPAPEGATHELLHGPALVVVNDGKFDAMDDAALCRFGLSNKPNDAASIGKFGLGLKSVFHLGEAFFFLAPANPAGGPELPYGTLANPWSGTEYHTAWNDVDDEDLKRIQRHLAPFLKGRDHWFCLWIPLRRQAYCRDASFRGDHFDGDQPTCDPALLGPETAHMVGRSLPLLHSVRTVTLWNTFSERLAEIRLANSSGRSQFRAWALSAATSHAPIQSTSGGEMAVAVGDDPTTVQYGLAQSWLPSLLQLTEDPSWPKSFSAARGRQVRDKALPHGAVCLARWTGSDRPGPDVAKAVFLPLGAAGGPARFAITLHGCFFVDAGRRDIITGANDIRGRWNDRLLRECVYPNLLPAVQQLASGLAAAETFELTKCLGECAFVRRNILDICGNLRWLRRWTEGVQDWTVAHPEDGQVLTIPAYGDDASLPGRALPALAGIAKSCVLTPADWPRLESGSPDPWDDDGLADVVASFAAERWLADSAGELGYLAQLLEIQPRIGAATVTALTRVLRRVFTAGGNAGLDRHADALKRLVALVPAGRRLHLPLADWPVDVRKVICAAATSVLIVPAPLGPADNEGTGRLHVTESTDILQALAGAMTPDRSPNTASDVVAATENRQSLLDRIPDLALWVVQRLTKGSWERLVRTAREIRSDRDRCLAFIGPTNEYARDLAAATADDVWVVAERAAGTVFPGGGLPRCDANSVLAAIRAQPRLAAAASRAALLRRLLDDHRGGELSAGFRWAARYLLHGSAEIPTDALLMEEGDGDVWAKVTAAALAVSETPNRLLPRDALVRVLSAGDKEALGIAPLNPRGVAALLGEVGATRVTISVSQAERRDLLRGLDDYPDLIRALPLHDRSDGQGMVRIEDADGHRFYWESDDFRPTTLRRCVTLLRPCADPKLAAIQQAAHPHVLDAEAAVRLAMELGPAGHWRDVLDALPATDDALKARLSDAEWLPVAGGGFTRPGRVLHNERCDEEIAAAVCAVAAVPGDPIPFRNLAADVRKHAHLKKLARLFPRGLRLWGAVGKVLRRDERFRIGPLDDSLDLHTKDGIDQWLDAFRNAPDGVMAVRALVERAYADDPGPCESTLLPALKDGDLSPARLEKVLSFLRGSDERARGRRDTVRTVHDAYLRIAARSRKTFRELLPRLKLLSRAGDWRDPGDLCVAVGLDPAHTLAAEQEEILKGLVKRQPVYAGEAIGDDDAAPRAQVGEGDFASAAKALRDYFEPWRTSEETERWAGAFLALLGDFEPLKQLAADLLSGPSPDVIRLKSGVQNGLPVHEPGGRLESPAQLFARQRVLVQVTDPRHPVPARNLLGDLIPGGVKADLEFQDLFIGYGKDRLDCPHLPDIRVRCLHLRTVIPADFDGLTDLRQRLARTGDLILKVFYGQPAPDFGAALDEFSGDDGYAIRVAQETFFDGAPYYLRMLALSATRHEGLRDVLALAGKAARRASDEAAVPDRHLPGESAIKLKERLRAELRRLLENDETVRAELVNAVRRKVKEFRYERRAIAFELFQNADDAYVERNAPADQTTTFLVESARTEFLAVHDGRPINRPPAVATDGDAGGYAHDIAKMLSLGHSEKAVGPVKEVTGQFGLGFKSVFLVCDRPRVVSGRLAFEVLGGVYPRPLPAPEAKALRHRLPAAHVRPDTATEFHLAVRDGVCVETDIIADFRRLAHLLVVFARRIRTIHLDREQTAWAEQDVLTCGDSRVVVGNLTPFGDNSGPSRAIVIRTPTGDITFGLDADGLVPLPEDIPSVWVTAPTGECHKTGYAVNGPFLLDVGRSQMDWNADRNRSLFEQLGSELGVAFVAVFDEDWGLLRSKAQLIEHDRYAFWNSVWNCFIAGDSVPELLKGMVWDDAWGCAARLYRTRRALPTGVPIAKHRVLTSVSDVSEVLDRELDDDDQSVLRAVAEWPSFQAFAAGTLASGRLWRKLGRRADWVPDVARVDLAELLRRELESSSDIDPDRARLYGQVITCERTDLRELLRSTARFRSRAGHWALARELLLPRSTDAHHRDEVMRAAFAPPERVLGSAYTDASAAEFFLACRDQMVAPIDVMIEWAVRAEGADQREAVRRYMAEGEQAFRFNQHLRKRVAGTWLESITDEEIEAAAGDNDFAADVMRTAIGRPASETSQPSDESAERQKTSDAAAMFQRVAEWWRRVGSETLKKYDRFVYPDGRIPRVTADGLGAGVDSRVEWLKLFITGIVQTTGRVTADQNRAFVRLCASEGWLTTLADSADGPREWLAGVERYIDRHHSHGIRYFHWLRHFVGVATVSRHLEAYVDSFLAVDRFDGRFTPPQVLSTRTSRQFQFGGPDAPTLAPILGIGSCFVLRDLVRAGLVTRGDVHPYCYAPVLRIRNFLGQYGWVDRASAGPHERSRAIYTFVAEHHPEDPTFGNSFDIPLLMYLREHRDQKPAAPSRSRDGDFITLWDGRVVPRR